MKYRLAKTLIITAVSASLLCVIGASQAGYKPDAEALLMRRALNNTNRHLLQITDYDLLARIERNAVQNPQVFRPIYEKVEAMSLLTYRFIQLSDSLVLLSDSISVANNLEYNYVLTLDSLMSYLPADSTALRYQGHKRHYPGLQSDSLPDLCSQLQNDVLKTYYDIAFRLIDSHERQLFYPLHWAFSAATVVSGQSKAGFYIIDLQRVDLQPPYCREVIIDSCFNLSGKPLTTYDYWPAALHWPAKEDNEPFGVSAYLQISGKDTLSSKLPISYLSD